jgi:CHRD domain
LAKVGARYADIVQGAALRGQVVPPVFPSGTATADLTYDPATRVVTWTVTYSGLSGPATMAHFHGPSQPGKNAPVLVWLTNQGSPVESPINGQATLTPDQARQFEASDWYIDIHTQTHPDGEIRGLVLTRFRLMPTMLTGRAVREDRNTDGPRLFISAYGT